MLKKMAVPFSYILAADFVIAIPILAYYYYWGVILHATKGAPKADILKHVKNAYTLTGFAMAVIPALLVYYLYDNLLYLYPEMLNQTIGVMAILVLVFEYVNYYSYVHYERGRI